jgi:hypothetical protein
MQRAERQHGGRIFRACCPNRRYPEIVLIQGFRLLSREIKTRYSSFYEAVFNPFCEQCVWATRPEDLTPILCSLTFD